MTPAQPELNGYSVIQEELWANKGAGKKYGPYSGNTLYSRPVVDEDYFAVAATAYTQYIIDWVDTSPSASTDSWMPRPKRLIIAVPTANSNVTVSLFSADFLSILYISCGNSAVGSGVPNGFELPEKFVASKYLAKVLILVTVAPVKSLPAVV